VDRDGSELGVRLASVKAGVRVTWVVCAAAGFDVAFYADPHNRLALAAVLAIAVIGAAGMGMLPWETIVRSRWREPAFLGWSLSNVAALSAFGVIDHTPDSAIMLMFLVPIVFVSMSYPRRSVLIVSAATLGAFLGVALMTQSSAEFVVMFTAVLGCTALMGSWQASNHDRVREELARMSRTDPLTGILNRRGFEQRAEETIATAAGQAGNLAVVLVDLDGFKQVNDTRGHAAGDAVLRDTATRLAQASGPNALIGRLGGDEFALLLPGLDERGAAAASHHIEDALRDVTSASVGVAAMPRHGSDLDALIGWADRRLYEVKLRRRAHGVRTAAASLAEFELTPPEPRDAVA
jgi:diguanylate cyclase (GGDEF)-like protein